MGETDFAVDKVVDPFSPEDVDLLFLGCIGQAADFVVVAEQSRTNNLVEGSLEAIFPFSQCSGVMRTDGDEGIEDKVAFATVGSTVDERGDRGQDTTGEDPFADEVDALVVGFGARLGHGDALEHGNTALALEYAVYAAEVRREELDAYSFRASRSSRLGRNGRSNWKGNLGSPSGGP